jgi:cell division protein FtsI (penicillin-binding protein 3)
MSGPAAPDPDAPLPRREAARAEAPGRAVVPTAPPQKSQVLETTRKRLVFAVAGFAVLFGAVSVRLADVTLLDPRQPRRTATAAPPAAAAPAPLLRAPITDRNGEVLAVSLPVTALYANPRQIQNPREVADRLRTVLPQLDRERVIERLQGERQFAYLLRAITPREVQRVNDLGIPGLYFESAERRFHPQGRAAVHILGNADVDAEGISGIEKFFDERLRNRRAEPLRLSLDIRAQLAMRDAVQHAIRDFNGIGGAGILLDVHTSEIIAIVSLPDYDPAEIGEASTEQRFNRTTVGVYEPGSTFKLFTAAMALEYGTVNIWSGYDAARPIRYGRFEINDFRGRNRWLTLPEIIAYSSNIASAHMAMGVGPQRHREFMRQMGMLQRLHVELPESATPLAPGAQAWRDINTMTIGFGHGISVTPLHIANGVAALANGGILRQPTLLALPPGVEREGTRVISERNSDIMRRLMRAVVTDGSGRSAEVPGYFVGGKTGTAQKTGPRGGYLEGKRIAAFVGAFPMHAPRYALYVMVDEPKPNARSHGYATAGWVAAPAAAQVIQRVAPVLGLVPEDPRDPRLVAASTIPLQPRRGQPLPGQPGGPAVELPPLPVARPAARPAQEPPRAPASAPVASAPRPAPAPTGEPRLAPARAPEPRPAIIPPGPIAPGSLPPPTPLRVEAPATQPTRLAARLPEGGLAAR